MAQHFKEAARCLAYFEDPVNLKCGYICCRGCLRALPKEPGGQGLWCFNCSKVSQTADIKPNRVLGRLAAKAKAMEPQLASVLQMDPKIRKFHLDMTLDVDTAHNYLTVSEDLKRVRIGDLPRGRRAHPGRFNDSPCVLGSPRFTSGRHYWEVAVGRSRQWSLGLCRESAPGQGEVVLSAELGFWTVSCKDGNQFIAGTEPALGLTVQPRLRRLGLFLDVEVGTFSFYHVANGAQVFTFPAISAEGPLRPFPGPAHCTGMRRAGWPCVPESPPGRGARGELGDTDTGYLRPSCSRKPRRVREGERKWASRCGVVSVVPSGTAI